MVQGRDFRPGDRAPRVDEQNQPVSGLAIVNEAFARVYFDGQNPVGRKVSIRPRNNVQAPVEIVGLIRDAAYFNVREPMRPTLYIPLGPLGNGSLIVRTSGDPMMLASNLRQRIATLRPDLRIRSGRMSGLVRRQMLRERLLATLSSFLQLSRSCWRASGCTASELRRRAAAPRNRNPDGARHAPSMSREGSRERW